MSLNPLIWFYLQIKYALSMNLFEKCQHSGCQKVHLYILYLIQDRIIIQYHFLASGEVNVIKISMFIIIYSWGGGRGIKKLYRHRSKLVKIIQQQQKLRCFLNPTQPLPPPPSRPPQGFMLIVYSPYQSNLSTYPVLGLHSKTRTIIVHWSRQHSIEFLSYNKT